MQVFATSPPWDMHSCLALIGRLPCPCNGFQDVAGANVCNNCLHSFSHHVSSTTTEPMPELNSQVTIPAPTRARSVTALFQSLLKSTPHGSLAIQETSATFRKSGSNTLAASFLGISQGETLNHIAEFLPSTKSVCTPNKHPSQEHQPHLSIPFGRLCHMWPCVRPT